jgi:hypothetical protein
MPTRKTDLPTLEPDPLEPQPEEVEGVRPGASGTQEDGGGSGAARGNAESPRWQLVGYFALEPPATAPPPERAEGAEPERAATPTSATG